MPKNQQNPLIDQLITIYESNVEIIENAAKCIAAIHSEVPIDSITSQEKEMIDGFLMGIQKTAKAIRSV